MATPVWISLGSNLGDRKAILDAAVVSIGELPGVILRAVSSYHETKPVGGPSGQGPFLNAAAHLETTLDPFQLLKALQGIENQAGRVRIIRWGERTLDLDILVVGTKFLDTKELKLPHPRMAFRRFVLAPLSEIAPNLVDTMTRLTVLDLLENLDRQPRLLAIDGFPEKIRCEIFWKLVEILPGFGISMGDGIPRNDDLPLTRFNSRERMMAAVEAGRRAVDSSQVSWIVTDFFIELDYVRERREMRMRSKLGFDRAKIPTLVVSYPSPLSRKRRPAFLTNPHLWPESDDPEAIVAEVVATCRGIEAV